MNRRNFLTGVAVVLVAPVDIISADEILAFQQFAKAAEETAKALGALSGAFAQLRVKPFHRQ